MQSWPPDIPPIGIQVLRRLDDASAMLGTVRVTYSGGIRLLWDDGEQAESQAVLIYDVAQANIRHGAACDGCNMNPLHGLRWTCSECDDYDLCSDCYHSDVHNLEHAFTCTVIPREMIIAPDCENNHRNDSSVNFCHTSPQRKVSRKLELRGIVNGSMVRRGEDWMWNNEDGHNGNTGTVVGVQNWLAVRDAVAVDWIGAGGLITPHRVGCEGKVDLTLVRMPSTRPRAYVNHLPSLDAYMINGALRMNEVVWLYRHSLLRWPGNAPIRQPATENTYTLDEINILLASLNRENLQHSFETIETLKPTDLNLQANTFGTDNKMKSLNLQSVDSTKKEEHNRVTTETKELTAMMNSTSQKPTYEHAHVRIACGNNDLLHSTSTEDSVNKLASAKATDTSDAKWKFIAVMNRRANYHYVNGHIEPATKMFQQCLDVAKNMGENTYSQIIELLDWKCAVGSVHLNLLKEAYIFLNDLIGGNVALGNDVALICLRHIRDGEVRLNPPDLFPSKLYSEMFLSVRDHLLEAASLNDHIRKVLVTTSGSLNVSMLQEDVKNMVFFYVWALKVLFGAVMYEHMLDYDDLDERTKAMTEHAAKLAQSTSTQNAGLIVRNDGKTFSLKLPNEDYETNITETFLATTNRLYGAEASASERVKCFDEILFQVIHKLKTFHPLQQALTYYPADVIDTLNLNNNAAHLCVPLSECRYKFIRRIGSRRLRHGLRGGADISSH